MRRIKSVGTKVTEDEYAMLQRLAAGQTLSEWVRDVVLAAAAPRPADQALMAEFLALRMIVLGLHYAEAAGELTSAEAIKRLAERADAEKSRYATERLAPASMRRRP
jgi:hypothetical protein